MAGNSGADVCQFAPLFLQENILTKKRLGRKGFTSIYRLQAIIEESQGRRSSRSLEAAAAAESSHTVGMGCTQDMSDALHQWPRYNLPQTGSMGLGVRRRNSVYLFPVPTAWVLLV